jgi:hypothetical protein
MNESSVWNRVKYSVTLENEAEGWRILSRPKT